MSADALHPAAVQFGTTFTRQCGDEREPDGDICPGAFRFGPDDAQAACDTCGGWAGRWAPGHEIVEVPDGR